MSTSSYNGTLMLMKPRQWMTTLGLLGLVVLAVIGLILTRDLGQPEAQRGRRAPLVNEKPLQTAREVASLASDAVERRYAAQVEKLADHEVDLAFADALHDAAEHPVAPTAETKELQSRQNKAEAAIKANQDRIDQLKKQIAAASGSRKDTLQQELDFALVQQELDQDELEDAKDHLLRSGADPLSRIRRQFSRHEANEHALEASRQQTPANNKDVDYLASNLWAQFGAWRTLRNNTSRLQQALSDANDEASTLTQKHDVLEKQVKAGEEQSKQSAISHAANQKDSARAAGSDNADSATATSAVISSLQRLSGNQKDLIDLNKRIQDHQELSNVYSSWIDRAKSHERESMHGMIQSALLITIILLGAFFVEWLVDRFFTDLKKERTRLRTLRTVVRFAVQAVGLLLIFFVIFGAPSQTPTVIGLAGAGLTVALKDFIVAFFGWFMLMGRNGIRVGDWVEINGVVGEVVEINLLRTVLLETGNWADAGHPTGRKVAFVNSFAIEGHFFNFSTSGQWLWDEIEIMVPPDQDPYPIIEAIQKMAEQETEANAHAAEEEWLRATRSHQAQSVSAKPAINLRPTTSGVEVHLRYITRAHERYAMRTRLYQALVELMRRKPSGGRVAARADD
ncbi:MAG: LigA [Candidatus Angelobacter sp.]|nr:LigA [Candidatus Angelobacter sp.]